ncbi:MAG: hypothetical protein KAS32_30245 [Candidatus Peribacteraceae bacterium]|nr:hypothetical protein [Candidatus Peribacteraceae bacterium]
MNPRNFKYEKWLAGYPGIIWVCLAFNKSEKIHAFLDLVSDGVHSTEEDRVAYYIPDNILLGVKLILENKFGLTEERTG